MISDVVSTLSTLVTDELARAGLPQLVDGEIKLGQRYTDDAGAPRIWFVPRRFDFKAPSTTGTATIAEARRPAMIQRALSSKATTFEVHVIGPADAPDVPDSYRFTELLADLVIWAAQECAPGGYELSAGEWVDQAPTPGVVQPPPQTHHLTFGLVIRCPVADKPTTPKLAFVPAGTSQESVVKYAGSTEQESA